MQNKPNKSPKFRAFVVLANGTRGHQVPNAAGDQSEVVSALSDFRRGGNRGECVIVETSTGRVVGHSEP